MIAHREIMTNIGLAVRDSAAVLVFCREHFSRGLDINVGAYPNLVPGADDSPFLWITPKEENDAANANINFTVRMVVGGCVLGTGGEKVIVNRMTERTAATNGLTVNGGNAVIEALRDLILEVVAAAKCGAPVVAVRKTENDISHFPLEWAESFVDFFTPADVGTVLQ